jgi:hypothetical protein
MAFGLLGRGRYRSDRNSAADGQCFGFNARRVLAGVELVHKIIKGQFGLPESFGTDPFYVWLTCSLRDGCTYLQQIPFKDLLQLCSQAEGLGQMIGNLARSQRTDRERSGAVDRPSHPHFPNGRYSIVFSVKRGILPWCAFGFQ